MTKQALAGRVLLPLLVLVGIGVAGPVVTTPPDRMVTSYSVVAPIPLPVKASDNRVLGAAPIGGLVEAIDDPDRGPWRHVAGSDWDGWILSAFVSMSGPRHGFARNSTGPTAGVDYHSDDLDSDVALCPKSPGGPGRPTSIRGLASTLVLV